MNFADCFAGIKGRKLLAVDVRGLLCDVQRKNAEARALDQGVAPRTLQRFLESIVWDEVRVRDKCQRIVARDHADPEAIGMVDETGTAKSGNHTAGVKRQYNGNRGKVENCINSVAIAYATEDFHCLINARLYLPREWCADRGAEKNDVPADVQFQTKPQMALDLIDHSMTNGVVVKAWTFDEFYGHNREFLDGLEQRDVDGQPKVFRDSAVTNLRTFFDRFRTLNVGSNAELESLVTQAQQLLRGVAPQDLRSSDSLRIQIREQLRARRSVIAELSNRYVVKSPRRFPSACLQRSAGASPYNRRDRCEWKPCGRSRTGDNELLSSDRSRTGRKGPCQRRKQAAPRARPRRPRRCGGDCPTGVTTADCNLPSRAAV